jgi:hypothetical protein
MTGLPSNTNPAAAKNHQMVNAGWQTKITRAELQRFAKGNGHVPIFLRDWLFSSATAPENAIPTTTKLIHYPNFAGGELRGDHRDEGCVVPSSCPH